MERQSISRGLAAGMSLRAIARDVDRAPSTISRELARHGERDTYCATVADVRALDATRRPRPCALAVTPRLCALVAAKLRANWSPEQIAGWLPRMYPGRARTQISHATMYESLFVHARGVLKKELVARLRTHHMMRKSTLARTAGQPHGQIRDAISISDRPAAIEDRAVPEHWESDLLAGLRNSHFATLVERTSRFTMLVKVRGTDIISVVSALQRLPAALRRSLAWHRGMELARHQQFTLATTMAVYFCDPQSPWQCGMNENTNGRLRQYLLDGTDLRAFAQSALNRTARELKQRLRKKPGFRTPAEMLFAPVALTD